MHVIQCFEDLLHYLSCLLFSKNFIPPIQGATIAKLHYLVILFCILINIMQFHYMRMVQLQVDVGLSKQAVSSFILTLVFFSNVLMFTNRFYCSSLLMKFSIICLMYDAKTALSQHFFKFIDFSDIVLVDYIRHISLYFFLTRVLILHVCLFKLNKPLL